MEKNTNYNTQNDPLLENTCKNEYWPPLPPHNQFQVSQPRVNLPYNQLIPQNYPPMAAYYPFYPPTQMNYLPPMKYYDLLGQYALEHEMRKGVKQLNELYESNSKINRDNQNNNSGNLNKNPKHLRCCDICERCVERLISTSHSQSLLKNIIGSGKDQHDSSDCQDPSNSCPALCESHHERCCCHYQRPKLHYCCRRRNSGRHNDRVQKDIPKGEAQDELYKHIRNISPTHEVESTSHSDSDTEESFDDKNVCPKKNPKSNRTNNKRNGESPQGEKNSCRSSNVDDCSTTGISGPSKKSRRKSRMEETFTRENPPFCTSYFLEF